MPNQSLEQALEAFDDVSDYGNAMNLYRVASNAFRLREITNEEYSAIMKRVCIVIGEC